MRHPQRGMTVWPFVITLVLFFAFAFLWYSEKTEAERANKLAADREKTITEQAASLGKWEAWGTELSDRVGYKGKASEKIPKNDLSDPELIANDVDPSRDGSAVKALRDAAKTQMVMGLITFKPGGPTETALAVPNLSQQFRDKVKEAQDAFPGNPPAMPDDPDNAAEMAKWRTEKEEFQKRLLAYVDKLSELTADKEWPQFQAKIGQTSVFDADAVRMAETDWFIKAGLGSNPTLQEWMARPPDVIKSMVAHFSERLTAALRDLEGVRKEAKDAKAQVDAVGQQLKEKEDELNQRVASLQREAAEARSQLEAAKVEASTAAQQLTQEKERGKLVEATLSRDKTALEEALRIKKQMEDLEIQRDDPDGTVVGADATLGVAYLNLGFADHVYPGMHFRVTSLGRGLIRQAKGVIMVTKVIDAHYSQARIVSSVDGERPIGNGDAVHNPFFDKTRKIHIFLAGDLRKYPRTVAVDRLRKLGAVVDDAINRDTDFIVVPESMTAKPAGAAEGAEGDAAPAPGQTEYDRLVAMARTFGATLVTERLLEQFLGY